VLSVALWHADCPRNVGADPYIESVFENDLAELDTVGTLAAAEDNEHALIAAETRRLHIAAHWAHLHPGDATPQSRIPGTQHPIRLGGDGTPTIADFAPADIRRFTAIGILAQPAQALQLLYQHQDDDWDGRDEPADLPDEPDPDQNNPDQTPRAVNAATATDTIDEATRRSLQITPPPLDPAKARPRGIIYVHLSEEASAPAAA
jgi:hypothetical protein